MKVAIMVKLLCLWVTEGNLFEVFKSKIDVDTCKKGGGGKKWNRKYFMYCNLAYNRKEKDLLEKKEPKSRYDVRKRNKVNLPVLV